MKAITYRLRVFLFGIFVAILGLINPNKAIECVIKALNVKGHNL